MSPPPSSDALPQGAEGSDCATFVGRPIAAPPGKSNRAAASLRRATTSGSAVSITFVFEIAPLYPEGAGGIKACRALLPSPTFQLTRVLA